MKTTSEIVQPPKTTDRRRYTPPKLVPLGKVSDLTGFGGSVTPDGFGNMAPMA